MEIKIKSPNAKFLPLFLLFVVFNIAPLAIVSTKFIEYSKLNSSINELIFIISLFILVYGINYLIGSYYFSGQGEGLKSEVIQSILHLFSITRTACVIILIIILVYTLTLKTNILLMILLGLEVTIFIIHFIIKTIKSH
jgi:hypothetical protein